MQQRNYKPPTTDTDLEWYTSEETRVCLLFIKYKIFPRVSTCQKCQSECKVTRNTKDWHKNKYKDSFHYQCNVHSSHTQSIRNGTIYQKSQLPLSTHLRILYKYYYGIPVSTAAKQLKNLVSRQRIIEYYKKYRSCLGHQVQNYYFENENRLGRNAVLEIDESKFNAKPKHRRGGRLGEPDHWVFGLVERGTGRCFMITVEDRSSATLIPIIRRIAAPGATIVSDQWRGYLSLGDEGFVHVTVNHSVQFVDPLTGEHSNTIESLWARSKSKIKYMNGIQRQWAQSYLNEFMFRRLFENSSKGLLTEMIVAVANCQSQL